MTLDLPKTIYFITSQELEDMYPDKMPIEREQLIGKEKKAVFIMGIRVDETSLKEQLEKSKCMDRLEFPYHQKILKKELPYTIGGGIGQSRILMLLLEKSHIALVQASSWETKTLKELKDKKVL